MSGTALLSTKLRIPELCTKLVARPDLLARLNEGLVQGHRVTLISAPAGFGKTNLLSEWVSSINGEIAVAWLSLDTEDNNPIRFWAYLIAAIQSALGQVGETSAALVQSGDAPYIEAILTVLINEIATQPEKVILVLDDYHLISDEEIQHGITFLIEFQPTQLHLVICTRADPPLPLVRIRAKGQLTELRGDDLRFNDQEANNFLNIQMGLNLTNVELRSLDRRIEGWITGLQLAAISLRDRADRDEFISSFSSSHTHILEYLTEEVFKRIPAEELRYLTQTSILDELCTSLCDRVTGRKDSEVMLAKLYRENLFVSALDYEHHWYRYHQLFAESLRARMRQMDRQMVADLHLRASQWYEENGYLQTAVRHAQQTGDIERVAELAEQAAQASLLDSWMTDLLAWLERLPADVLRNRLRLGIYQACAYFFNGDSPKCINILDQCEQALEELPATPENAALQVELCRLIDIIQVFVKLLQVSMQGKFKESIQIIQGVMPKVEEAGQVFLTAHLYEGLALSQFHQGQLQAARSTCLQLIDLASSSKPGRRTSQALPIAAAGYLLMANICLEQNKLAEMAEQLSHAIDLCRQSRGAKSLAEAYVMQSRLQQAQGELESATQSIAQAQYSYPFKTSMLTPFRIQSQKAKLDLEAGALEKVIEWINGLEKARHESPSGEALPALLYEVAQLILARYYLVTNKPQDVLKLLEPIERTAEADGHYRHLIEIQILKALALQVLNRQQAALRQLERALKMAKGEGFSRAFMEAVYLEKGLPMQQLLFEARKLGITPRFTDTLLAEFPLMAKPRQKRGETSIEPLSKREKHVLEELAEGWSNREIAQHLDLSVNTIKTHTGNIYNKLGVHKRDQAVIKAKALGLINR